MATNAISSANVPFFLYKPGITVPEDATHVRVDPSVAAIPNRAFAGLLLLKVVVLPEGIQKIGVRAFRGCRSLERVNFPSTLTAIRFGAFAGCVALREVDLSIVVTIGNCAFMDCNSLGRIILPSTVTAIGARAFDSCTSLREVKLSGGIQDIGRDAFHRCSSLEWIAIPTKAFVVEKIWVGNLGYRCDFRLLINGTMPLTHVVTSYGRVVIASECLESMSVTGLAEVENAINAINRYSDYRTCEDTLGLIRALLERHSNNLRFGISSSSLAHLPLNNTNTASHINTMSNNAGNSANYSFFLYTEGAIVPWNVTHVRFDHSVTVIPTRACIARPHLKEVMLPEGIQRIGAEAFRGCTSLERVMLPEGIQRIGAEAFRDCTSLEQVNFPSTLTVIGEGGFSQCASLTGLKLVEGIEVIGDRAFGACTSLGRIILPSTVTAIGARAFEYCTSLREVKLFGGIQDIGRDAFCLCSFLHIISIPSKAFVIEDGVYNCRLLTNGTITRVNNLRMVIASWCLRSMSVTDLVEVEYAINAINHGRYPTREEILERIRVLPAYYELPEVTTILELALWKARMDEYDDLNAREEYRVTCGAGIIIPNVLSFL